MTFSEFVAMGGHGFYIWSAYGMAAGLCALELFALKRRRARAAARVMQNARMNRTVRAAGKN
ncbi:MAG: heme exporter protein CcmD [Duodenibacillus sp.]|nr:heme exporter protein CcmD [Duodenibacillus sp.]